MKKIGNVILIVIIGILMFGVGLMLGLVLSSAIVTGEFGGLLTAIKIGVAVLIGVYLSIIAHEAGHLVCGLISGYRFSSFRIFSLMMMKQEGKMVFRKFSIPGTGGQCLMMPPKDNNKPPFKLYLYGGTIANLILALISIPICILFGIRSFFSLIFIMIGAFSLYFAFTNGIPRDVGGMSNDAMNVKLIKQDKNAREAFMKQLLISEAQTRGTSLQDMPIEWFSLPNDADKRNTLCTSIKVFYCNRLMNEQRFEEANEEMKKLLSDGANVISVYRYLLRCDRIFCELLLKGNEANISSLYTKQYKRFAKAMGSNSSILRTECAVLAIRDKDKEMAEKARQNFVRKTKNSPFKQDTEFELHLIDLIFERAFGDNQNEE